MKRLKKIFKFTHLFMAGCVLLVILSFLFSRDNILQLELSALAIISYICFTLVHHYLDKTLTLDITIEYILLATLALILTIGVLT